MVVAINHDGANLGYFFQVRVTSAFRVHVRGCKGNVVSSRRVNFPTVRVPR